MATIGTLLLGILFLGFVIGILMKLLSICLIPFKAIFNIMSTVAVVAWCIVKVLWQVVKATGKGMCDVLDDAYDWYCRWYDKHYAYRDNWNVVV